MPATTDDAVRDHLPFRVRIGLAAAPIGAGTLEAIPAAVEHALPAALRALLFNPPRSGAAAPRTPIRWRVLTRQSTDAERRLAANLAGAEGAMLETAAPGELDHLAQHVDLVVQAEAPADGAPEDPLVTLARRHGRPVVTLVPFGVERGLGLNTAAYERLNRFNTAPVSRGDVERVLDIAWREAFDTAEGLRLPPEVLSAVRHHLATPWARADLLARRCQATYRRAGQAVWCLFPIAVAAVALGALYPSAGVVAFPAQAGLLMVMLVVVWRADRTRSLEGWVEHRLLAERLRVAAFMRAAGFEPGAFEPPPHLGHADRSEWITLAFNELRLRMPAVEALPRADPAAVRAFVAHRWVGAQRAFHVDRATRHLRWSRALERAGHLVFLLAILIAIGHTVFALGWVHATTWEHLLLFLGLVLPGAGAALGGFRAHREYSRIARRSAAMASALAALERHLETTETEARLEEHLRQVEQVILGEVLDWVVLMRVATVQPVG